MQIRKAFKNFLPQFIARWFEGRQNLRKIVANLGWMFFDRVLRLGVGLIVGIWVARYLGPEKFGILHYAVAFTAFLGVFAGLGLDGIIVRDVVNNLLLKDKILGTAFVLKLIGGLVSLILSVLAIMVVRPNDILTKWIVGITASGFIFQAFDNIDFWFQSQVRSKYTVYAKNTAFLIGSIIKIVLIKLQAPLIMFAWAGLGEIILGAIGLSVAYKISGQYIKTWDVSLSYAKKLLKESWPLALSGISLMLYMKVDQIMLGEIIGNEAVGIYSAAVRISELWYFIPMAILVSVAPSIVEAKKDSVTLYYHRLQKTFNIITLLAYTIAIPMTFLSKPLVLLLYGQSFGAAGTILAIHIWAALFVFLGVIRSVWITAEGFTKITLMTTTIGCILNIILNLVLIPKYGGVGAAMATVISYGVSDYFIYILIPAPEFKKIGNLMTNALFNPFLHITEKLKQL